MKTAWLSSLALVVLALILSVPLASAAPVAQPAVSAPVTLAPIAPAVPLAAPANGAPQLPDFLAPPKPQPVIACPELPPNCCAVRCTICCVCTRTGFGCGSL